MEYCYAVCFSNGVIKFGRTCDLHARLTSHAKGAGPHGVMVICALVSGSRDSIRDEAAMLDAARNRIPKQDAGQEYYLGSMEDAICVMLDAGLLPVPSHVHQSGSISVFAIARAGADLSKYRIIKPHRKGPPLEDRLIKLLSDKPMKEGVLVNRCRNFYKSDIVEALGRLCHSGRIAVSETKHPVTGVYYSTYTRIS